MPDKSSPPWVHPTSRTDRSSRPNDTGPELYALRRNAPGSVLNVEMPIPERLTQGRRSVRVGFRPLAKGGSIGAIFDVRILTPASPSSAKSACLEPSFRNAPAQSPFSRSATTMRPATRSCPAYVMRRGAPAGTLIVWSIRRRMVPAGIVCSVRRQSAKLHCSIWCVALLGVAQALSCWIDRTTTRSGWGFT